MSKVKIEITSKNKKLIRALFFQPTDEGGVILSVKEPYGCLDIFNDIANCLGYGLDYIKDSEYDSDGKKFPKEIEDDIIATHNSIIIDDSYEYIISLIIQYCVDGGLEEGVYECIDYEKIWSKI